MTSGVDVFSDTDPVGPVLQPETVCIVCMSITEPESNYRPDRVGVRLSSGAQTHNNQAAIEGFVSQNF